MCNVVSFTTNSASAMQVMRAPAHTSTSTSESGNVRGRCWDAGSGDQAVDPAVVVMVEATESMGTIRKPVLLVPLCR